MMPPCLLANQFVMQLQQCFLPVKLRHLAGTVATSKKFRKRGTIRVWICYLFPFDMIA
jgi:hypothetical protein